MFRIFLFAALIISVTGCGGGGNDTCNDSVACIQPDQASLLDSTALLGSYDIRYSRTSNSCNGATPLNQLLEQYVASSGFGYHGIPTIELTTTNGVGLETFSTRDNTDGKTYFTATEIGDHGLTNFIAGKNCSEAITINFTNIKNSRVVAKRISDIFCANPGETIVVGISPHCQVVYDGSGGMLSSESARDGH